MSKRDAKYRVFDLLFRLEGLADELEAEVESTDEGPMKDQLQAALDDLDDASASLSQARDLAGQEAGG